jgi:threonyl-tRNA synthetase
MAQITFPDGSVREYPDGVSAAEVAASIGSRLAKDALAAKLDGKPVDLATKISGAHGLQILTAKDRDGNIDRDALEILRHSTAHAFAQAARRVLGDKVQYTIGPPLMDDVQYGFYYDLDVPGGINDDQLAAIEKEMAAVVKQALPIERSDVPPEEAERVLGGLGQKYKLELIRDLAAAGEKTVSLYRQGDFVDLCRGPHIPHTGRLAAFKLMAVAGAYWRGKSENPQLTRVYGTAFFSQKELDEHLARLEEAKKRDHRVIGKQLGLFTISPMVGSGLVLWMPKGATLRYELETFIRGELTKRGYQQVYTPHVGNVNLYRTSGHFPYYRESQFPPIHMWERTAYAEDKDAAPLNPKNAGALAAKVAGQANLDEDHFLLKPMNCPHHIQIFAAQPKSYRDLPVRLAEFGTVYRYEESGELNGLTRVRGFTQDDAHLFCTPEQVEGEFRSTVELVQYVFASFSFKDVDVRLSVRDPANLTKYVGAPELWDRAEKQLESVLRDMNQPFTVGVGEAAFYGPKVDFMVRDVLGRKWQLGTVQLDYNLPERFGLEYIGPDNKPHRPVMIHRAPFGSLERFTGILIEQFAGAFPTWLAPVQAAVLPVSEKFDSYARGVYDGLRTAGVRAEIDLSSDKIGAKIRRATLDKVPYMLVVGEKEQAAGTVAVRHRTEGDKGAVPTSEFIVRLTEEIRRRA